MPRTQQAIANQICRTLVRLSTLRTQRTEAMKGGDLDQADQLQLAIDDESMDLEMLHDEEKQRAHAVAAWVAAS